MSCSDAKEDTRTYARAAGLITCLFVIIGAVTEPLTRVVPLAPKPPPTEYVLVTYVPNKHCCVDAIERLQRKALTVAGFHNVTVMTDDDVPVLYPYSPNINKSDSVWRAYVAFAVIFERQQRDRNDIVVYVDYDADLVGSFSRLFQWMDTKMDVPSYEAQSFGFFSAAKPEVLNTKGDAFVLMNCEDKVKCAETAQFTTRIAAFRTNFHAVRFTLEWQTFSGDPRLLSAENSLQLQENPPNFKQHRGVTSIFSLLAKLWDIKPVDLRLSDFVA